MGGFAADFTVSEIVTFTGTGAAVVEFMQMSSCESSSDA